MNEKLKVGKRYEASFSFVFVVAFRWVAENTFLLFFWFVRLFSVFFLSPTSTHWLREYFIRVWVWISCHTKKLFFFHTLIFCLAISFFHIQLLAIWHEFTRHTATFWYTQWPLTRNNNFYKRKLVFQSILFYISLVSVFHRFFVWITLRLCWLRVLSQLNLSLRIDLSNETN